MVSDDDLRWIDEIERLRAEVARLKMEHEALRGAIHDEMAENHQYLDAHGLPNENIADCMDRIAAERDALLARVEAWERAAQEGHPAPCTLGPLCPYCEIERLRDTAEALRSLAESRSGNRRQHHG